MEQKKTHLFSLLILAIFIGLALGSQPENDPPNCNDYDLRESEPITPELINYDHELTVLDKETNEPVIGIQVRYNYGPYQCKPIDACPEKCYMSHGDVFGGRGYTDINGQYVISFGWRPKDKKDRMTLYIYVENHPVENYSRRIMQIDIARGETFGSGTAYMLRNNKL